MTLVDTRRYPAASILLHWGMLLLIVGVYTAIEMRELFPKGSDVREALKAWHFTLGLSVLALVVVRILIRIFTAPPPITPRPPIWQVVGSRVVHYALYGLMIGMPLAGWTVLSAEGVPIPFFGLELPPLVSQNGAVAGWVEGIHKAVGSLGYWLIGLHAAAALFHHYVWKDDTLRRMLPSHAVAGKKGGGEGGEGKAAR